MNQRTKKKTNNAPKLKNNKNRRAKKKIKVVEVNNDEVSSDEDMDESADLTVKDILSNSENESEGNEVFVSDSENENNGENVGTESDSEVNNDDEAKSDSDGGEEIKSESDSEVEENKKKSKKRKRKRSKYNAVEEARLQRLVFGDASDVINNLLERDELKSVKVPGRTKESSEDSDVSKDSEIEIKSEEEDDDDDDAENVEVKNKAAWVDEDDAQYSLKAALNEQHRSLPSGRTEKLYTELLENKFIQLVGTPKWASLDEKVKGEDEDSDDEILKHTTHVATSKGKKLRKGVIDIKVLTDINKSTRNEGPFVSSIQFHPTSTVALVAGESGVLSLFQIDGRENNKLHSLRFDKYHISCAKFLKEGNEVITGDRNRNYSQAYDLMSGKTYKIPLPRDITNMQNFEVSPDYKWIAVVGRRGEIHLLSGTTKERVTTFKMNKRCTSLAFSPDSGRLISHGDSEEMYIWDLRSQNFLHRAIDDGCIGASAVAYSPSGQFIATGSKQGVVNIYDTESVLTNHNPAPLKIVLNLVTPITKLKFNPTSEILAMSSNLQKNAFKMVHLPSFTVFANFPTFQTKMENPLDIDFSPSSGYLGLSNNKYTAYLYRLKHYGNY